MMFGRVDPNLIEGKSSLEELRLQHEALLKSAEAQKKKFDQVKPRVKLWDGNRDSLLRTRKHRTMSIVFQQQTAKHNAVTICWPHQPSLPAISTC